MMGGESSCSVLARFVTLPFVTPLCFTVNYKNKDVIYIVESNTVNYLNFL
jgi:hypothetical protein